MSNPEFPQETSTGRQKLPVPTEPESGAPTVEQSGDTPSDERPIRQHRPPTLLTHDTLGTPIYHPAVPSSTSRNAVVAPLAVPILPRPVGGVPNAWMNSVWPMAYSMAYKYVRVYPCWIS